MLKDIRLYIADKMVDLGEDITLPITYQQEDFKNPTAVKIGWSKTISIQGTKNNNKIFGEFWNLDRMQHYQEWIGGNQFTEINFDPSKRTPFTLYENADIIESGYIQLNDISIQNNNITYNITLYSGLGDFFYGLKYNEDGTSKTLADLRYFIKDDNGNLLPSEDEMDFEISKDIVYESFSKDYSVEGDKLTDTLAFVPAYNGVPEDFDSSKCLVNTNGLTTTYLPTSTTVSGVTYSTYNGYALADLNNSYTEWETKDLRSYLQRPAIKVSKLIKAICREENSGYNVTFDETFFNERNPYWSKTFVALPLLTSNDYDGNIVEISDVGQFDSDSYWIGQKTSSSSRTVANGLIKINGTDISTDANGIATINNWSGDEKLSINTKFKFIAHSSFSGQNTLFTSMRLGQNPKKPYDGYYSVYLSVVDADTNTVLGRSTVYQFSMGRFNTVIYPFTDATVYLYNGAFSKISGNDYQFYSGNQTEFNISLTDCPTANRIKVYLNTVATIVTTYSGAENKFYLATWPDSGYAGEFWGEVSIRSASADLKTGGDVASGKIFTKETLLKTTKSPADFLLDYSKLFGLYYIKDVYDKSIYVCSRNSFFTGNVVDWSNRIDYSKDMTINPILFDKKYYLMQLDTPETKNATRYKSQYSQQYGQQRISTGYNFNYDTTNFYDNNIYQQIVPIINSDRLFRTYYDKAGHIVPSWIVDNATYNLYNLDDSTSVDLNAYSIVDSARTVEWNRNGRDVWAKSSFFSLDADSESLVEIESALLMWNGIKSITDADNNPIAFWITDDVPEMKKLNEDPCFLYTESETNAAGNQIAIRTSQLPQYLNCLIDSSNNVAYSLDFGLPKEVYVGDVSYSEDATIYNSFWKAFYTDQFNINTKKLTCFVKLDRMNQEYLRDFYFFNNSIWLLNKVDSYDITNDATVRCEFIKVISIENYTNGQQTF